MFFSPPLRISLSLSLCARLSLSLFLSLSFHTYLLPCLCRSFLLWFSLLLILPSSSILSAFRRLRLQSCPLLSSVCPLILVVSTSFIQSQTHEMECLALPLYSLCTLHFRYTNSFRLRLWGITFSEFFLKDFSKCGTK